MEEEKKSFPDKLISKISKYLPTVEKPTYRQPFNTRLAWTGLALALYFILSHITVFGISKEVRVAEQLRFFEIVLGSRIGSLMTLGIGPIVTAGILLQLLVGSKIIDWDMTKPEDRKKFQMWDKFLAILFCFLEAAAYTLAGVLPHERGLFNTTFITLQLAAGGILVMLLDELISKWGIGSGISLFIAAGVSTQIFTASFSPFPDPRMPGMPVGNFWKFLVGILTNDVKLALIALLPIISTILVFMIVAYAQDISVDIPLSFAALRGFGRTWSLKYFYTSNIPVILTAALLANLQMMARMGAQTLPNGLTCGILGCFDERGPVSGVIYYLSSPRNLLTQILTFSVKPLEILRGFTYIIFMAIFSTIFSIFWVTTAGMDAKSVAEQLKEVGFQLPGFRRDPRVMEGILNRYIPPLALLGGLSVGLLAAFADLLGAMGTGTGILLTVMIVYNYYEQIKMEKVEDMHPIVKKVLGE